MRDLYSGLGPSGRLRKHPAFHSRHLPADRDIVVYLPPGYQTSPHRRYPVLYLHDGQNLFDGETAFVRGQDWKVGDTATRLIEAGDVEPLIVVGIYNAGHARIDEYTPTGDGRGRGGKADLYGRLLTAELKPFIDAEYRTLAGPEYTGLGGSSLGGLVSLYLALRYPHVFGRVAALSPSVWWNGRYLLRRVRRMAQRPPLTIWLDMGTAEGDRPSRHLADVRALRDALVARGFRRGEDLAYTEADGAGHNEAAWAARVGPMLRFLFPAARPPRIW